MLNTAKETFSYIRQRADQLAHIVGSPDVHEILASNTLHPARALIIKAIVATPGLPEFVYTHSRAIEYRRAGFEVLGVGYHAVTVAEGPNKVRKFYRHSSKLSEAEQQDRIAVWSAKQDVAMQYLGAYAIPQVFSIEQNPINPHLSVISATQHRINASSAINIFAPGSVPVDADAFMRDSQRMHDESQSHAVPDLIGRENAVIEATTGAIKLIDPITLIRDDPEDTAGYHRVVRYFESRSVDSSE